MEINHPVLSFSDGKNAYFSLPEDQINGILLTNYIISGISIAASLIVIIIFWFFKEIRNFKMEMVIWLCISNIFYNATAYFPYSDTVTENKFWCGTQAYMIIMFQNSSWILSCVLGYCAFISVIRKDHIE